MWLCSFWCLAPQISAALATLNSCFRIINSVSLPNSVWNPALDVEVRNLSSSKDWGQTWGLISEFLFSWGSQSCAIVQYLQTVSLHIFWSFVIFFGTGIWTQGVILTKWACLPLKPICQSFFCDLFLDRVCQTICPGLASNRNPPDFCLLSS
jgi:hypothetical protein